MIPIGTEATDAVLVWEGGLNRTLALRHAAIHSRPGLWGDHRVRPTGALWLRDAGERWEAFAAGFADPALDWLLGAAVGRPIVLAAPPSWAEIVRARLGPGARVEQSLVQTWLRPASADAVAPGPVRVRRLDRRDAAAFAAIAPSWALRSWGDFGAMLRGGPAFGVPTSSGRGLLAASWVVESDGHLGKVGVATDPRFRRLGLGRAAASALVEAIEADAGGVPLWVANPGNTGSLALARSLGFTTQVSETLLRWGPA